MTEDEKKCFVERRYRPANDTTFRPMHSAQLIFFQSHLLSDLRVDDIPPIKPVSTCFSPMNPRPADRDNHLFRLR